MRAEWHRRGTGLDLSLYVTRETLAGIGGHLWVLGIAQGALLGLIASWITLPIVRSRSGVRRPMPAHDVR